MLRSLLCLGLCLATASRILADDSPAGPQSANPVVTLKTADVPQASNDAKAARPASTRKTWEALLRTPVRLDFGKRQTVTVQEVLDQIHRQHQISIRFDVPTFMAFGGSEIVASPSPDPAPTVDPAVAVTATSAPPAGQPAPKVESAKGPEGASHPVAFLSKMEVNIQNFDTDRVSIATVLRHALDAIPISNMTEDLGNFPIVLTNASLVDYLVEDEGLLITTRMNALTVKETRVYSVKRFKEFTPEQLSEAIRATVRPWSWRTRIDDLGDQLKDGLPQGSSEMATALVATGMQLAAQTSGIEIETSVSPASKKPSDSDAEGESEQSSDSPADSSSTTNVDAQSMANGLVLLAQASISALEIVHFSDLPTGTVETLPGKLIITQSQAAHREIADLLEQLAEE